MLASIASGLGRVVTQRAAQLAITGLVTGAIAGAAVVVAGLDPFVRPTSPSTVALLSCPGSGPELARVPSGETLLITARSLDGHWLEVYLGQPGIERAWAPANELQLEAIADGLPVDSCNSAVAVALPSPGPQPTGAAPTIEATVLASPAISLPVGVSAPPTPLLNSTP